MPKLKYFILSIDYVFFDTIYGTLGGQSMLNGDNLADFFEEKGYHILHHVNTVATALTFLRNGGLLSREYVANHPASCFQTLQKSDAKDKELGIFNDIFFDIMNIWQFKEVCFYGPVVFEYNIDVLRGKNNIRITKTNPQNWDEEDYYNSIDEIYSAYNSGYSWPLNRHIIFHDQQKIDFSKINKIIFYRPDSEEDLSIIPHCNRPDHAFADLRRECDQCGIPYSILYFSKNSWQNIISHGNTVGRFYGFRMKVPTSR